MKADECRYGLATVDDRATGTDIEGSFAAFEHLALTIGGELDVVSGSGVGFGTQHNAFFQPAIEMVAYQMTIEERGQDFAETVLVGHTVPFKRTNDNAFAINIIIKIYLFVNI